MMSFFYVMFCILCFCKAYGFVTPISTGITKSSTVFYAIWGIANGPLGGAVVAWKNSLVLHDLEHMAGLFIHMSPPIVSWAMRWHAEAYEKRWPGIFGMPLNSNA